MREEKLLQYKIDAEDEKTYKNIFKLYTSVDSSVWLGSYLFTLIIYGFAAISIAAVNINLLADIWFGTSATIKVIALMGVFILIQGIRARNVVLTRIQHKYAENVVNDLKKNHMRIKKVNINNGYLNYICV